MSDRFTTGPYEKDYRMTPGDSLTIKIGPYTGVEVEGIGQALVNVVEAYVTVTTTYVVEGRDPSGSSKD